VLTALKAALAGVRKPTAPHLLRRSVVLRNVSSGDVLHIGNLSIVVTEELFA
jgi:hypothetical protein